MDTKLFENQLFDGLIELSKESKQDVQLLQVAKMPGK